MAERTPSGDFDGTWEDPNPGGPPAAVEFTPEEIARAHAGCRSRGPSERCTVRTWRVVLHRILHRNYNGQRNDREALSYGELEEQTFTVEVTAERLHVSSAGALVFLSGPEGTPQEITVRAFPPQGWADLQLYSTSEAPRG